MHDESELERALRADARVIGVNQRDHDLQRRSRARRTLAARFPSDVIAVAESGIRDADDARRLADAGYDAILVGETLVRASDPGQPSSGAEGIPVGPR